MLILHFAFIFLEGQSCSRTQYEILLYLNWRKTSFLPTEQLNESWNLIFPRSMQILEGRSSGFSFSHYETKRPAAPYNALDNSMQCSILLFCLLFFIFQQASSNTAPPIKEQQRSVPLVTALGVCGGAILAFMSGCIMAFLYRRARRNHEVTLIECNRTS